MFKQSFQLSFSIFQLPNHSQDNYWCDLLLWWIWETSDISSGSAVPTAGEQVLLITSGTKIKQPDTSTLRQNMRVCARACACSVWPPLTCPTFFCEPSCQPTALLSPPCRGLPPAASLCHISIYLLWLDSSQSFSSPHPYISTTVTLFNIIPVSHWVLPSKIRWWAAFVFFNIKLPNTWQSTFQCAQTYRTQLFPSVFTLHFIEICATGKWIWIIFSAK